jgi:hypothetical protein
MVSGIKIAIASHDRAEIIQKTSLTILKNHNIPMSTIYVFVSPESYQSYKPISEKCGFTLVKTKNNIKDARNHIIKYFKRGEKILEMDDDIKDIVVMKPGKKNKSLQNLKKFMIESFSMLKNDQGLWGVNATDNNREGNSRGKDKFGSYSIINSFCGYVNNKKIKLTVPEKEDFDRSAQFIKMGIPVLKRTGFGIVTNYWKNPGGIQSRYSKDKRVKMQRKSAKLLMKKFPHYFYNTTRKNGIVDIKFRSPRLTQKIF